MDLQEMLKAIQEIQYQLADHAVQASEYGEYAVTHYANLAYKAGEEYAEAVAKAIIWHNKV